MDGSNIRRVILNTLREICGTDEIVNNPQLELFERGFLDSFGMVELMLTIHEELGIEIAPTELERESWSTAEKIIRYLEEKEK